MNAPGAIFSDSARREWIACRAILMHAVSQRRAQGSLWMTWLLAGLALGVGVWSLNAGAKAWMALAFGVGAPLAMLLLMWWVLCFSSIVVQCNPIAMHLAPSMRARARRVTIAIWAVITLAMTLVVGVPTGYPGQVAVLTGLALMEISATFSVWRIAGLVAANWLLWHAGPQVAGAYAAFLKSHLATALGVLLVVLDGRYALRRMFGGPRRLPLAVTPAGKQDIPETMARAARLLHAANGDDTRGQPLIVRVLGPLSFGGERLALVLLAIVCAVMRAWIALQGGGAAHQELFGTRCAVLVLMLSLLELAAFNAGNGFARRIAEQSLVRLAPAAPSAAGFNRVLARYLLQRYTAMWGAFLVLTVSALWILGADAGELARAAAAFALALALAGVLLADFAHRRPQERPTNLIHVGVAGAMLFAAVAAMSGQGSAAQWAGATALCLVAGGSFAWYRWRKMVGAAPAFPAGRFT